MAFGIFETDDANPRAPTLGRRRLNHLALDSAVGFATNGEIDQLGIVQSATRLAIQRALEQINLPIQHLLVDYLKLPDSQIPYTALVKGDARSLSIAASPSILAKTAGMSYV